MQQLPLFSGWRAVLAGAFLIFALAACESVTQANYDKITTDMTEEQVRGILGEPDSQDSINLGIASGTNAVWRGEQGSISVQFLNGKVKMKNFSQK